MWPLPPLQVVSKVELATAGTYPDPRYLVVVFEMTKVAKVKKVSLE